MRLRRMLVMVSVISLKDGIVLVTQPRKCGDAFGADAGGQC